MKKQILITLILTLTLAACGGTSTEEIASIPTLDNSRWPTPVPEAVRPTATPFPRLTLAEVQAARAETVAEVASDNADAVDSNEEKLGAALEEIEALAESEGLTEADLAETIQTVSEVAPAVVAQRPAPVEAALSPASTVEDAAAPGLGALGPVAAARIAQREVEVRPAPTTDSAPIAELTDDQEALSILALDMSGDWALIDPTRAESRRGWVAVEDLTIDGSMETIEAAPRIRTAWVKSNGTTVRQGPALFHPYAGTLGVNTLVVLLGRNEDKTWGAIQSLAGDGYGWVRLADLDGYGPVAELPLAPPPPQRPTDTAQAALSSELREVGPGVIVFQRSSGGEIMVINTDGTGLRLLTHGIDPVLSPDGQTVAFTRWQQGEAGLGSLWTISLDGSNERQVLGFIDKQPKGPAWSPDGSRIVINYQHGGRLEEKRQCGDVSNDPAVPGNATDVEAGIDVKGPGDVDIDLCWTIPPDPHWGLRVVTVADGNFEDVDGGTYAFRPAWSPTQPWRIISDGGRGLVDVDLNQDRRVNLTENLQDGSPVFSPDSRFIALTVKQHNGGKQGHDLYRLNSDGSGRTRLTQTPFWQTAQPDGRAWNHVAPAWSPDGYHLAYLTDRSGRWEIWVMNADGSNQRPLFAEAINEQLQIEYNFVDERALSWR